jgi:transposase-like protein/IS1 family transposase
MNCPHCESQQFKVHQRNGHALSTMYRCVACRGFFSERRFTGYSGLKLPPETIRRIVECLIEGVSVRGTARLANVQKNTVLRVLRHAGRLCKRVMESKLQDLKLNYIQVDEIVHHVGKKERNLTDEDRDSGQFMGDAWIFLATDAETKLVPSFMVGKRDLPTAEEFMRDLAGRLANRPQITSDGLRAYVWAVEGAFGSNVDFGMLIKSYSERDGRLELTGAQPRPIIGNPKLQHISTSYAERNNLNCRLFCRRLTRLTNAYSRRIENLIAALWIYFAHYNFVKQHTTLRVSPAMAANITDHLWTVDELLNAGVSS